MNILCIETSTNCCSAAICKDGVAVASKENLTGANHASELPVFIEELLSQARENAWTIDAVALSEGPGSYTGLRIGASTAKGICYALQIPLLPIDTLQLLCVAAEASADIPADALLCPMLDARRMEVYTAFYLPACTKRQTDVQAMIINENAFAELLTEKKIIFFGNGSDKCKQVILSQNAYFVDNIVPQAQFMGGLAEGAFKEHALDCKHMAYYEPFYLKEFVPAASHVKGLQ
jgi:tRNA threonylcarbamoyladenosine biosynthesis protein TsaB